MLPHLISPESLDSGTLSAAMAEGLQVYTYAASQLGLPLPYNKRGLPYRVTPTPCQHCLDLAEAGPDACRSLLCYIEDCGIEWRRRGHYGHACEAQALDAMVRLDDEEPEL